MTGTRRNYITKIKTNPYSSNLIIVRSPITHRDKRTWKLSGLKLLKLEITLEVNPYLSFNSHCEAVFKFYKSVFVGEFAFVGRYKDIPGETIPDSEKEKIMHMALPLTETV